MFVLLFAYVLRCCVHALCHADSLGFDFIFYVVEHTAIINIDPGFGPESGGTVLQVHGVHLKESYQPTIFLGDNICPGNAYKR